MYSAASGERDCYRDAMNANYKTLKSVGKQLWLFIEFSTLTPAFCMNSLYRKDQCQSPDPPASSFIPSFAAVAAGVDKNLDKEAHGKFLPSFH